VVASNHVAGSEERLPRDFGKYRLVQRIATGGMAEIFLAHERRTPEEPIVIKRVLPHLAEAPDFRGMFFDEVRIAAQFEHENLVKTHDFGFTDGSYYITMEYVPGEDVRRIYNQAYKLQRSLPLSHSIRVIAEAATGLAHAHRLVDRTSGKPMSVVHRDVSPQNIVVTYDGRVKVVDFGIAKAAQLKVNDTRAGVLKGKYSYMSPEQAAGGEIDRRTDIFALGIILYETTTGTRLFKRHNELATLQAIMKCEVKPPHEALAGYPAELEQIVLKALAKDPRDRHQTADALSDELFEFLHASGLFVEREAIAAFMSDLFADRLQEMQYTGDIPLDPEPRETDRARLPTTAERVSESQVEREERSDSALHPMDEPTGAGDLDEVALDGALADLLGGSSPLINGGGFVGMAEPQDDDGTVAEPAPEPPSTRPALAPVGEDETRAERPERPTDPTPARRTDDAPTLAAARAYRAPSPAPAKAAAVHTDRVRAHRPPRRRDPSEEDRRRAPTVRPSPPPGASAMKPAVIVGVASFVLGILVLLGITVQRLMRPSEPPIAPLEAIEDPGAVGAAGGRELGQVTILTEAGATVSSNDAVLGRAGADGVAGPFSLPPGRHMVRVSLASAGFERVRALSVRGGALHEVEILGRKGVLRLAVAPWARVQIDGRDVGITPLRDLSLVEGTHHVVLENPDIGKKHESLVRIEPDKVSSLKVDLQDEGERL
jgi:serine/threonine protein kinase